MATQEIRDEISGIRNELPPEMEEPILTRFDPQDQPIVSLTLSSPGLTGAELTRMADPDITRRLRGIPGVASVDLVGGIERELVVEIRPRDLQAAGVSVAQVVQACSRRTSPSPVGRLEGDLEERTIRLKGRLDAPTDFKDLVVSQSGRTRRPSRRRRRRPRRHRGAALVRALQRRGSGRHQHRQVQRLQHHGGGRRHPRRGRRDPADAAGRRDAARRARLRACASPTRSAASRKRCSRARRSPSLVVFLFLNSWRSTVITGLALPVSVLASFVVVWVFGFTLNTMSLLGLSLAIGILIDDAIVVRENIVRHVEMGKDHYRAAFEGTDEIGLAVTATTLSIVVVFVPIAFIGGIAGQWFKPFALTIACSVLVSLFVSFSLDPMLSAYWPDPDTPMEQRSLDLAAARPLQPLVRSAGRRLQGRDRVGARPSRWR